KRSCASVSSIVPCSRSCAIFESSVFIIFYYVYFKCSARCTQLLNHTSVPSTNRAATTLASITRNYFIHTIGLQIVYVFAFRFVVNPNHYTVRKPLYFCNLVKCTCIKHLVSLF